MNKGPMDGARDGSASNRRSHVSWGNRLIRAMDQLAIVAIEGAMDQTAVDEEMDQR